MKKTVTVVGAGFSGLTLAHYLNQAGFNVVVYEKEPATGGLLGTLKTQYGLVETAANALLADLSIEQLFVDLDLPFADRKSGRKKRYIYWDGRPRRWPLTVGTTFKILSAVVRTFAGSTNALPQAGESIHSWSERVVNAEFRDRLLVPALQGIYAGDSKRMSAPLILKSLLGGRTEKGELKGSVAPELGMGQLIRVLTDHLKQAGVEFKTKTSFTMPEYLTTPVVLCTSAWKAAEILKPTHPQVAQVLSGCESLPLVSTTCFFPPEEDLLEGFGCLFPPGQGFTSLGVLFNTCIFEGRSNLRSETWILGGARNPDLVAQSDDQILEAIRKDRERLTDSMAVPKHFEITRWSRAIPHYTVDWERALKQLSVPPPVFLHGNYLGELGLARIHTRSRNLAQQLKEMYG